MSDRIELDLEYQNTKKTVILPVDDVGPVEVSSDAALVIMRDGETYIITLSSYRKLKKRLLSAE